MENYYLFLVVVLFILAISDLVVGVSNDAVNFLNSAVGSKVAPRRVIMIMASLGIFIGATFSSGMMEIARSGVFNPEFFTFQDVMVIFLAVMMTDIILLDLFNTFGLPTSTTVSIVFELLGAATIVAVIKVLGNGQGLGEINQYLNWTKSLAIISGIFLSVGIAFTLGTLIQFLSRLIFGFQFKARLKYFGGLWGGISVTALTYFLLIKGLKGASFISPSTIDWVIENTAILVVASLIVCSIVMQFLVSVFKVNILQVIVLFGTFALAMAFAGNDLVNFIGVPIAGFESFGIWSASGTSPDSFSMERLAEPVQTPTYLLLIAGSVMVLTLWFSKKARSVTDTEVNLARQDEGTERFEPNNLSRAIVRLGVNLGKVLQATISPQLQGQIKEKFTKPQQDVSSDKPAFDLIRASVNLTVASILISFGTSLKLPLSTTYVSFMVAMGSSLADQAWGRDSAVYRVAGVLNVIGGWFLTAFIAFLVSAAVCAFVFYLDVWAVVIVMILIGLMVYQTFGVHARGLEKTRREKLEAEPHEMAEIARFKSMRAAESVKTIRLIYANVVTGLIDEDRLLLQRTRKQVMELRKEHKAERKRMVKTVAELNQENGDSRDLVRIHDLEKHLVRSLILYVDAAFEHVNNMLNPLKREQIQWLKHLNKRVELFLVEVEGSLKTSQFDSNGVIFNQRDRLLAAIDQVIRNQAKGVRTKSYSSANSLLLFTFLMETQHIVSLAARYLKLFKRFSSRYSHEALVETVS